MVSSAAARGRKVSVVSSWKLDSSTTKTRSIGPSTQAVSGRPMLPQTSTRRPAAASRAPVSAVVVLLPFEPVMPTTGPFRNGKASSTSAIPGSPRRRAAASSGRSSGTPGESTTPSRPSGRDSGSRPSASSTPGSRSRSGAPISAAPRRSTPTTSTPRARRKRAAAGPDRPRPYTSTRRQSPSPHGTCIPLLAPLAAQLQGRQTHQREQNRQDPEPHDDLGLRPAGEREMVVQRRHAEDPPAGELERGDLDDHRQRLEHEQPAHQDEQQLLLGQHRHRADGAADGQRPDVAHEPFGGMGGEPQA